MIAQPERQEDLLHYGMSTWLMSATGLGRVITQSEVSGPEGQFLRVPQAAIAAISDVVPTMFMTRVRL
jgi:hypothetical protein